MAEDRTPNTDESSGAGEREQPVCPHCIEPVDLPLDHFCPHCLKPISPHASTDPLGSVFAQGHVYMNAACGPDRPHLIAVLSMWLIFGPQVLILLGIVGFGVASISPGNADSLHEATAFGFLLSLALAALYIAILWKVTRKYLVFDHLPNPA